MRYKKHIAISMVISAILFGLLINFAWQSPEIAKATNQGRQTDQRSQTNHVVRINEIMAGANGNSDVQFIEMELIPGQNLWGPGPSETAGRVMLVFSDAAGNQTGRFVFPSNAPNSGHVLIGTQAFADLPGAPQPDFIIPPEIMAISGKVCFKDNPNNIHFGITLCVSYGNFTGNTEGAGPPVADTLPILNTHVLQRVNNNGPFDFGFNSNADFALATIPSPTNAAGDSFTISPTSSVEQGRTLFMQEKFNGNGRACADCHMPEDHFGLTPATVNSFPPDHTLFIAEFNLNTLVLTGDAQPSDLRGTITAGGVTATVLTGKAAQTYLIYGGQGLTAGTVVTDQNGNSGTIQSFTEGDLDNLEDPTLMRGGNALILENIDGFGLDPSMRGSPHLLNIDHTAKFGLSGHVDTLLAFTKDAVRQHAPRTLARVEGVDFRLPTDDELSAMDVFMRSIQMPADGNFDLDRFVTTEAQKRGQELFFGDAKCSACHAGLALAATDGSIAFSGIAPGQNGDFDTGVIDLPNGLPSEINQGTGSRREFNTPPLFGIKETAPFFHDNSVATLREAVEFYDTPQFQLSPAGQQVGSISVLNTSGVDDIVAFLEALVDLPFTFSDQLDFGSQDLDDGPTSTQSATITNNGTTSLTITDVQLRGNGASHFTTTGIPSSSSLAPGESRTIEVAFNPSTAGLFSATLEITVSDANEPWDVGVALSGEGITVITPTPTPSPTPSPSSTPSPTPTGLITVTPTPTGSVTFTPTPTPSLTPTTVGDGDLEAQDPHVSPSYGFSNVPTLIYIHGDETTEFIAPLTVMLGNLPLEVVYVDSRLISALVPSGLDPGFYDVSVQYSGQPLNFANGYEVLGLGVSDLISSEEWLWSNPLPLRVGYSNSSVGLLVQLLGGRQAINEVTVEFRLESETGPVLGRGLTNILTPYNTDSTSPVTWEPTEAGEYTVCAIIDPDNDVPETNENNNVVCRVLTVLDIEIDQVPPEVEESSFLIANDLLTTDEVTVTLSLDANDPGALASGMQAIKYIEFEYILGAHRWVPVQRSAWIDYEIAKADFPWSLVRTYGMRYMQAWAGDNVGNISLIPGVDVIDLLPTEQADHVAQYGVVFYRVLLEEGQSFSAALTPESGDPDLYVWGPNGQLWPSNAYVGPEQISFQAPTKGTYQIEVHGFTDASYKLNFSVTEATSLNLFQNRNLSGPKPAPPEPAVALDNWPEFFDIETLPPAPPSKLYLPLVIR